MALSLTCVQSGNIYDPSADYVYCYWIAYGDSTDGTTSHSGPPDPVPTTPGSLTLTSASSVSENSSITIQWGSTTNTTGYYLERQVNGLWLSCSAQACPCNCTELPGVYSAGQTYDGVCDFVDSTCTQLRYVSDCDNCDCGDSFMLALVQHVLVEQVVQLDVQCDCTVDLTTQVCDCNCSVITNCPSNCVCWTAIGT